MSLHPVTSCYSSCLKAQKIVCLFLKHIALNILFRQLLIDQRCTAMESWWKIKKEKEDEARGVWTEGHMAKSQLMAAEVLFLCMLWGSCSGTVSSWMHPIWTHSIIFDFCC